MAGPYYIHIADPGFPEPPYPGVRRIGPIEDLEAVKAQAVEDMASGGANVLGIYDASQSDGMADKGADTHPSGRINVDTLKQEADDLVKERVAEASAVAADFEETLNQRLPEGVTIADLRAAGMIT